MCFSASCRFFMTRTGPPVPESAYRSPSRRRAAPRGSPLYLVAVSLRTQPVRLPDNGFGLCYWRLSACVMVVAHLARRGIAVVAASVAIGILAMNLFNVRGRQTGKGTIQIKFDQELPTAVIKQLLKAKATSFLLCL